MARTSYEERGAKFARYLFKTIFKGCRTLGQYRDVSVLTMLLKLNMVLENSGQGVISLRKKCMTLP